MARLTLSKQIELEKRLTKKALETEYNKTRIINNVAKIFGVSNVTIKNYLVKYDIKYDKQIRYDCDHEFFSRDNEESFYVAGLLAADGNLNISKGTPYIRLALSEKDLELVEKVKSLTKAETPIRTRFRNHSVFNGKRYNSASLACLEIASRKMFDDLMRFNIVPNKTDSFSIPDWLKIHPLVNHFMRGLCDGDGSFYVKKKVGLAVQKHFSIIGTVAMVETYRDILERECDLPYLGRKIYLNRGCGVLSYGGNGVVGKIAQFLYRNSTIYLVRKHDIVYKDIVT